MIRPDSVRAARALALVRGLQARFAAELERASDEAGHPVRFQRIPWLRDEGRHGGGDRAVAPAETMVFNRASVNISQVHYDDLPDKRLASATALSTIIHPQPPCAPSVHAHISFTELRTGQSYWRIMADLNPAIERREDTETFARALRGVSGSLYSAASAQGDRYFFIPALGRHRGVTHFYLESYDTGDFEADAGLAERFGEAALDTYASLLASSLRSGAESTTTERQTQLAYHTLYFFQVLTLDRGTTSGLLVHDQNDEGILGSLPARVDRALLESWRDKLPSPQDRLLDRIIDVLGDEGPSPVDGATKRALAQALRAHYQAHPEALKLQASGEVIPPTVNNHGP